MVSLYSDIIFEQTAGFVLQIWTLLSPGKSNGSFLKATAPPHAIGFLISLLWICFKAWCRWTWHVLYLWKCNGARISKSMFLSAWRANTQIQIHKYTNTQIQLRAKLQIDMACAIFMKRYWYEGLKINVPGCLACKYTNTNTQIHKYSFGQSCR